MHCIGQTISESIHHLQCSSGTVVWNKQQSGRTDFSSPISCTADRWTAFSKFWFFLTQFGELKIVIFSTNLSVHRTDCSTELSITGSAQCFCVNQLHIPAFSQSTCAAAAAYSFGFMPLIFILVFLTRSMQSRGCFYQVHEILVHVYLG